ncbi:hypothetical protein N7493_000882 [Penicillium malachiteum]|uniref:Cupin type-1 domain-containing protein n=1 Tax=Penicillium malachiteum TaxID=1324776 RepID=A0AAD6N1U4_9EURO|nr:hypothetical protein N7493_000882 [Penicillium malachiteum]
MSMQIIPYDIKPTKLIPNSPRPLLLYKGCFLRNGKVDLTLAFDIFKANGWDTQWVTTYGHYQRSHYHSTTHEAMVVVSGPGKIRWGTADFGGDPQEHTYGDSSEDGALYYDVNPGDIFVIPAGVAHKSYDPSAPSPDPISLTGGGAHKVASDDPRRFVKELDVSGFTMMGAYPRGMSWEWSEGGAHVGRFESVWNVPTPDLDPFFGATGGINEYWNSESTQ